MKYLIFAQNTDKFRTATGWIKNETELFACEKMLSFNNRSEADNLINKGFKCCVSYAVNKYHPLYKHC